ncbi:hypothetical protein CKALI_11315 [Corynebacterium kalinowskii]|uniref:Scaffolding protein n=1 Tax=Corynebacterium kalinowskii TaxID=2675216 RepID=A0A6B8VU01_9CORY|nr:hypothetical protein [Corynebacterium kalinowskii]QGU03107.1 hypothetical protein CKALI_11315 [Corynebacterium kalinowskii]
MSTPATDQIPVEQPGQEQAQQTPVQTPQVPGEQQATQPEDHKGLSAEDKDAVIEKLRKENAQRRVESKELKERAQKWDEFEESQKTELQRATEAQTKLAEENARLQAANTQLTLATAYGIKAEDIALLGTGTAEEMEERAKRIQELYGASQSAPTPPPSQRPHEGFIPGTGQRQDIPDDTYPAGWTPKPLRKN